MTGGRKHILLIEEHEGLREALTVFYQDLHHYVVHVASSAHAARGFISRKSVDILVVDITDNQERVPRLEALAEWRSNDLHFAVIVTSADDDRLLIERAFSAGADDFLRKPYLFAELHLRISRLITKQAHLAAATGGYIRSQIPETSFSFAGASVSPDLQIHFPNGTCIRIGKKLLQIINELRHHAGRIIQKEKLVLTVWGADANPNSASIHQYLYTLRKIYREGGIELDDFISPESKVGWRVSDSANSPALL